MESKMVGYLILSVKHLRADMLQQTQTGVTYHINDV